MKSADCISQRGFRFGKRISTQQELFAMTRVMKSKTIHKVMPIAKVLLEAIFQLCHFSEEENARYTQLVHNWQKMVTEFLQQLIAK